MTIHRERALLERQELRLVSMACLGSPLGMGVWTARLPVPDQSGPLAVYLYGEAAQVARRRTLPAIRAGEYEALPEKVPCFSDGGRVWGEPCRGMYPLPSPSPNPSGAPLPWSAAPQGESFHSSSRLSGRPTSAPAPLSPAGGPLPQGHGSSSSPSTSTCSAPRSRPTASPSTYGSRAGGRTR